MGLQWRIHAAERCSVGGGRRPRACGREAPGKARGLLSNLGLRVQKCQQLAFLHHLQVTSFPSLWLFICLELGEPVMESNRGSELESLPQGRLGKFPGHGHSRQAWASPGVRASTVSSPTWRLASSHGSCHLSLQAYQRPGLSLTLLCPEESSNTEFRRW